MLRCVIETVGASAYCLGVLHKGKELGRTKELEGLFLAQVDSIEDVRRYDNLANRYRTKRKVDNA